MSVQERSALDRYESGVSPVEAPGLTRRDLFAALGAGILLLVATPDFAQESGGGRRQGGGMPQQIGAWIHIGEQGIVGYSGKVEVGQNCRTSLTQAIAEELRVPVSAVTMVLGDTALTPFDMGTFGSQTTPRMVPQIRRAAAAARGLLLDLAAAKWQVDRALLTAADGAVAHAASNRRVPYAELAKGQSLQQTITEDVTLTPPDKWTVLGTSVPKVNGRDFVTGRHKYASDIRLPGMLYGKVLRPPAFHATLKSVDLSAAQALPGVVAVRDGDFVAVAAPTTAQAIQALGLIKAEWDSPPGPSNRDLDVLLRPHPPSAVPPAGPMMRVLTTYHVAYIAHTPLEPRAAVAQWEGGKLNAWTGTQRPFGVRSELAAAFNLPETSVHVVMPDTGSGYGGKHTGEAAVEAARIAKAAGAPVKLIWTREEEFTWAYFRPAGVIDVDGTVSPDGTLTAWSHDNYNSGPSGIQSPYHIPDQHAEYHEAPGPLRPGSYRALAATANHFARESHMDMLAHALKMDPLAFRRKNITDDRLRAVLEKVAAMIGWEERKPQPGRGFGLACGTEKGSYVAHAVELTVDPDNGAVRLRRIVAAYECGAVLNPLLLQNQVEGGTVMGIGGALFEEIRFDHGRILNPHLSGYRVPRFEDVPKIEVALLDRKDLPSVGAGETPIVTISPAIANAIFEATGKRLTSMPLASNGVPA